MRGPVSFSAARVQVREAAPVPTAPTSRSAGLGTSVLQPHTHICTPGPEATLTPRFPAKRLISNRRHVEVSILPHYFFFFCPIIIRPFPVAYFLLFSQTWDSQSSVGPKLGPAAGLGRRRALPPPGGRGKALRGEGCGQPRGGQEGWPPVQGLQVKNQHQLLRRCRKCPRLQRSRRAWRTPVRSPPSPDLLALARSLVGTDPPGAGPVGSGTGCARRAPGLGWGPGKGVRRRGSRGLLLGSEPHPAPWVPARPRAQDGSRAVPDSLRVPFATQAPGGQTDP